MLLAIDAATPIAGVAFYEAGRLLYEVYMDAGKNHSETLMPCIDQGIKNCGRSLSDVEAIALSIGPGSFTGLRIGLAAAKALGLALEVPLLPVSTLEMLAHNVSGLTEAKAVPMLNARKGEVYAGLYDCSGSYPRLLQEEQALAPEVLARQLQGQGRLLLLGDGALAYAEVWQSAWAEHKLVAPAQVLEPRAGRLADLAWQKWREGYGLTEYAKLKPVYLRLSEAEYRLGKGEL